jgi:hypothetical protein
MKWPFVLRARFEALLETYEKLKDRHARDRMELWRLRDEVSIYKAERQRMLTSPPAGALSSMPGVPVRSGAGVVRQVEVHRETRRTPDAGLDVGTIATTAALTALASSSTTMADTGSSGYDYGGSSSSDGGSSSF